jgi:hypothetical protein
MGRELTVAAIPARAIVIAAVGTAVAWILYGVAFRLFVVAVMGDAAGTTASYVAVYTGSYLVGYLVLFAPGGVGFREASLVLLMPSFGLASTAEATLLAVASRLWLTVLEVLPGLTLLALGSFRGRLRTDTKDASS